MGYKLAGYDVIGCVEIDPQMMSIYRKNHNPKHPYLMGVGEFNKIPDSELPKEFFDLDILDGSPPCSSFSMAGSREKKWGKKSHFREGQASQHLDDLFFDFIATAKKLQPKVVVAENVKGLIQGNARGYVKEIFRGFREAGYSCQLFLLNAAAMGVPQRRERTFFIANKSDIKIKLHFAEKQIPLRQAFIGCNEKGTDQSNSINYRYWKKCKPGESISKYHPKGNNFQSVRINLDRPASTLIGNWKVMYHTETMRNLSQREVCRIQSYPEDYRFGDVIPGYVCGMSVPPFMMQRVSTEIYKQLLGE